MDYYISNTNSSVESRRESARFIPPEIVMLPPAPGTSKLKRRGSNRNLSQDSMNDTRSVAEKKGPEVIVSANSAFMMNFKHLNL